MCFFETEWPWDHMGQKYLSYRYFFCLQIMFSSAKPVERATEARWIQVKGMSVIVRLWPFFFSDLGWDITISPPFRKKDDKEQRGFPFYLFLASTKLMPYIDFQQLFFFLLWTPKSGNYDPELNCGFRNRQKCPVSLGHFPGSNVCFCRPQLRCNSGPLFASWASSLDIPPPEGSAGHYPVVLPSGSSTMKGWSSQGCTLEKSLADGLGGRFQLLQWWYFESTLAFWHLV